MKSSRVILIVLLAALSGHAQPMPLPPPPHGPAAPAEAVKEPANYIIRVEWKADKEEPKFLELLTTEGTFNLNTIQKNPVKINNNEVPITLKFSGSLTALDGEQGRLQLFLGRTVPYITGTSGSGPAATSSYSQLNVGLDSTFVVKFGKPQMIQSDENGEISVLVKRAEK